MPTTLARNLHPIAVLQPVPFKVCPETAAHTCRTVVVARIPDFSAYITDGGQGCTAAFISLRKLSDDLKISIGKM